MAQSGRLNVVKREKKPVCSRKNAAQKGAQNYLGDTEDTLVATLITILILNSSGRKIYHK